MNTKAKKFLSYYKPYMGLFLSDMFFAILGAAVTLIIPLIIRHITSQVIYYEPNHAFDIILRLCIAMVFLVIVEGVSNYYIATMGHIMGAKMEYDMRNEIFEHYQKLSFNFYDNQKVGQLMSRVTNDLFDISELFHHGPEDIIISMIKIIGSSIILLNINVKLALACIIFIPFMLVYAFYFNKKMNVAFKNNRAKIADINAGIEDNLSGIRVVKSFANEKIEIEKFHEGNGIFLKSKKNSYMYMGAYNSGLGAMTTLISVAVIGVGGYFITKGNIAIGDLIAFILYISNFTDPVKKLISFTEQFQNGISGYQRFLEIIEVEPDVVESDNAIEVDELEGEIEFRDVKFSYEESAEEVLTDINLLVRKGEYIALVGSSGAGKSTLCSLIPRFYDVTSGEIMIDGINIKDISLKSLRDNIGMVQQDVYLFAGSVMDNIRYGRPDASDEEVIEAAKNANAHDFIVGLPDGYNTYIGQRGVKLSGGQKQRLSIARVFLKNPPILIFDEATSALDNESEKVVQESLEYLAKDRTTIVIAHRLSTIKNAKKIIVLTEEGIAEQGTHNELIARGGIYESLYNMQFN